MPDNHGLVWKICGFGCYHASTPTHHAMITPYEGRAKLLLWRRGEMPKGEQFFFQQQAGPDCVTGPGRFFGCGDPVASAQAWAGRELFGE